MSKILIALSLAVALFFGASVISGCRDSASDDVEDAARQAGDALEKAAEDVGEIVEDAVDAVDDTID